MYRRLISSLVLAAFLVGQVAAIPHAHGLEGSHSEDHASAPHIHLGTRSACLHGAKHHASSCHHKSEAHGYEAETAPGESQEFESLGAEFDNGHHDHDADAIYLPSLTTATGQSGTHLDAILVSIGQLACFPRLPVADPPASKLAASYLKPEVQEPGCALYLALRTLRI